MKPPKLAICGPGRCGKDTATAWLASHTILKVGRSTSQVIAPYVARMTGLTVEAAFPLRHRDRELWFKVGNDLRHQDPAILVREAIKDGDIVQGLRNADEVTASRAEGLVDLFLWIDREVAVDPTMTFGPDMCDLIIDNNQSLEEFYRKLHAFSAFARILL